jgi:hypothetical protein
MCYQRAKDGTRRNTLARDMPAPTRDWPDTDSDGISAMSLVYYFFIVISTKFDYQLRLSSDAI